MTASRFYVVQKQKGVADAMIKAWFYISTEKLCYQSQLFTLHRVRVCPKISYLIHLRGLWGEWYSSIPRGTLQEQG